MALIAPEKSGPSTRFGVFFFFSLRVPLWALRRAVKK
jgi:hypothetical protein